MYREQKHFIHKSRKSMFAILVQSAVLSVFFLALAGIPDVRADAPREISITGEVNFTISVSGGIATIRGHVLDSSRVERSGPMITLKDKGGTVIARLVVTGGKGDLQAFSANGTQRFRLADNAEQYRLSDTGNQLLLRVKLKEDKFNVYDKSGSRILHGKQKEDGGWGVKDEQDVQVLKIKGTASLKETSCFALRVEPEYRVLVWAAWNLPHS